jgi:hypothetical protein
MEQNLSCEASRCPTGQVSHNLENPKIHYHVHKSLHITTDALLLTNPRTSQPEACDLLHHVFASLLMTKLPYDLNIIYMTNKIQ